MASAQTAFDFREPRPPIAGATPTTRSASASGARAVVKVWTARQSAYLQVVKNAGSITDQEAAAILRWQLCSVNSVRGALNKRAKDRNEPPMLVEDGHEPHHYTDESGVDRVTYRTKWRVRS